MPNYLLSKIYKLVCDDENLIYYGSTAQIYLCNRLSGHHQSYLNKVNSCESKRLYDVGNVKIILVEKYPCETKEELLQRERWYIENNICVNKACPIRSKEERKALDKIYRAENKEFLSIAKTKYTLRTKEQKKAYDKQHYLDNKEKKKKQASELYIKNKEKILIKHKEKADCPKCGINMVKYSIPSHIKNWCKKN
tara:strand:+ start:107 stop:691 length:585 start_codon:yes stop_codon:yes gene_type:complete